MNMRACTNTNGDLTDTCSIGHINKLVHAQIDSYLGTRDHALQDYDELNVDEQIAYIDPQLWNAMCCITRSKLEIRSTRCLSTKTVKHPSFIPYQTTSIK